MKGVGDPGIQKELTNLLNQEGTRKSQIAMRELEQGLKEVRTDAWTIRLSNMSQFLTVGVGTALPALQKFGNWLAAAAFAGFLAWWWVHFLQAKDYTGAQHIKDVLLVVIGGALGWIRGKAISRKAGKAMAEARATGGTAA